MKLKGERNFTEAQVNDLVKRIDKGDISKGAAIREMFAGGMSVKEISTETGIRYNHVYNVVKNEVLVKGLMDEVITGRQDGGNSKKAQIVELLETGKTLTEVSQELKVLYNYVWQVAKAAGLTGKQVAMEKENEANDAEPEAVAKVKAEPKSKAKEKAQA